MLRHVAHQHKPVSVHRLLQLVVKYKLWIPGTKEFCRYYLHSVKSQNLDFTPARTSTHCVQCAFPTLPFVSFDVVPLDVLEVVSHVVLQRGHHAAVFVHQLSGAGLRREPVHHRRQLLLLHLLASRQQTAVTRLHAHTRARDTRLRRSSETRSDRWGQADILWLNTLCQSDFTSEE